MKNLKEKIQSVVSVYQSGNLSEAELLTEKLIDSNPNIAFLYNLLGLIFVSQKKINQALKAYEKGIKIDPNFAMIYNNLGLLFYNHLSNIEKAKESYKKSISLNDKIPEPHTNLGNLYNSENKIIEAIECHKKAIEINPKFSFAHHNLANVYLSTGKFDEARKSLQESVKLNPNLAQAHRSLSRLIKYSKKDSHFITLKKLYEKNLSMNTNAKVHLAFALGKAHEDMSEFDVSFNYYKEANSLNRKSISFSIFDEEEKMNNIKKIYNKDLFKKYEVSGCSDRSAIFIVGMPRSGTTLIEQILSSHRKVYGADEIEFIPKLINKNFKDNINLYLQNVIDFDHKNLEIIGSEYINNVKKISNNSEKVTDKFPGNFLWIGFIKLILPNSKIIHCYRNSKDNCFSIFKNHFPSNKVKFASDLNETVSYYNYYFNLMKYWNNLLPKFIYNIKYENLISNTETEIKNLLDACSLDWSEKCLNFYDNDRPIKTASDTQARKKIYKTSIDSWKRYQKHLSVYFDKLTK